MKFAIITTDPKNWLELLAITRNLSILIRRSLLRDRIHY